MQYKIKIDISPIISSQWQKYNGELNVSQFITQERKNLISLVKSRIDTIEADLSTSKISYTLDKKEREIIITIEWKEKDNIQEWTRNTKRYMMDVIIYMQSKRIIAYANTTF